MRKRAVISGGVRAGELRLGAYDPEGEIPCPMASGMFGRPKIRCASCQGGHVHFDLQITRLILAAQEAKVNSGRHWAALRDYLGESMSWGKICVGCHSSDSKCWSQGTPCIDTRDQEPRYGHNLPILSGEGGEMVRTTGFMWAVSCNSCRKYAGDCGCSREPRVAVPTRPAESANSYRAGKVSRLYLNRNVRTKSPAEPDLGRLKALCQTGSSEQDFVFLRTKPLSKEAEIGTAFVYYPHATSQSYGGAGMIGPLDHSRGGAPGFCSDQYGIWVPPTSVVGVFDPVVSVTGPYKGAYSVFLDDGEIKVTEPVDLPPACLIAGASMLRRLTPTIHLIRVTPKSNAASTPYVTRDGKAVTKQAWAAALAASTRRVKFMQVLVDGKPVGAPPALSTPLGVATQILSVANREGEALRRAASGTMAFAAAVIAERLGTPSPIEKPDLLCGRTEQAFHEGKRNLRNLRSAIKSFNALFKYPVFTRVEPDPNRPELSPEERFFFGDPGENKETYETYTFIGLKLTSYGGKGVLERSIEALSWMLNKPFSLSITSHPHQLVTGTVMLPAIGRETYSFTLWLAVFLQHVQPRRLAAQRAEEAVFMFRKSDLASLGGSRIEKRVDQVVGNEGNFPDERKMGSCPDPSGNFCTSRQGGTDVIPSVDVAARKAELIDPPSMKDYTKLVIRAAPGSLDEERVNAYRHLPLLMAQIERRLKAWDSEWANLEYTRQHFLKEHIRITHGLLGQRRNHERDSRSLLIRRVCDYMGAVPVGMEVEIDEVATAIDVARDTVVLALRSRRFKGSSNFVVDDFRLTLTRTDLPGLLEDMRNSVDFDSRPLYEVLGCERVLPRLVPHASPGRDERMRESEDGLQLVKLEQLDTVGPMTEMFHNPAAAVHGLSLSRLDHPSEEGSVPGRAGLTLYTVVFSNCCPGGPFDVCTSSDPPNPTLPEGESSRVNMSNTLRNPYAYRADSHSRHQHKIDRPPEDTRPEIFFGAGTTYSVSSVDEKSPRTRFIRATTYSSSGKVTSVSDLNTREFNAQILESVTARLFFPSLVVFFFIPSSHGLTLVVKRPYIRVLPKMIRELEEPKNILWSHVSFYFFTSPKSSNGWSAEEATMLVHQKFQEHLDPTQCKIVAEVASAVLANSWLSVHCESLRELSLKALAALGRVKRTPSCALGTTVFMPGFKHMPRKRGYQNPDARALMEDMMVASTAETVSRNFERSLTATQEISGVVRNQVVLHCVARQCKGEPVGANADELHDPRAPFMCRDCIRKPVNLSGGASVAATRSQGGGPAVQAAFRADMEAKFGRIYLPSDGYILFRDMLDEGAIRASLLLNFFPPGGVARRAGIPSAVSALANHLMGSMFAAVMTNSDTKRDPRDMEVFQGPTAAADLTAATNGLLHPFMERMYRAAYRVLVEAVQRKGGRQFNPRACEDAYKSLIDPIFEAAYRVNVFERTNALATQLRTPSGEMIVEEVVAPEDGPMVPVVSIDGKGSIKAIFMDPARRNVTLSGEVGSGKTRLFVDLGGKSFPSSREIGEVFPRRCSCLDRETPTCPRLEPDLSKISPKLEGQVDRLVSSLVSQREHKFTHSQGMTHQDEFFRERLMEFDPHGCREEVLALIAYFAWPWAGERPKLKVALAAPIAAGALQVANYLSQWRAIALRFYQSYLLGEPPEGREATDSDHLLVDNKRMTVISPETEADVSVGTTFQVAKGGLSRNSLDYGSGDYTLSALDEAHEKNPDGLMLKGRPHIRISATAGAPRASYNGRRQQLVVLPGKRGRGSLFAVGSEDGFITLLRRTVKDEPDEKRKAQMNAALSEMLDSFRDARGGLLVVAGSIKESKAMYDSARVGNFSFLPREIRPVPNLVPRDSIFLLHGLLDTQTKFEAVLAEGARIIIATLGTVRSMITFNVRTIFFPGSPDAAVFKKGSGDGCRKGGVPQRMLNVGALTQILGRVGRVDRKTLSMSTIYAPGLKGMSGIYPTVSKVVETFVESTRATTLEESPEFTHQNLDQQIRMILPGGAYGSPPVSYEEGALALAFLDEDPSLIEHLIHTYYQLGLLVTEMTGSAEPVDFSTWMGEERDLPAGLAVTHAMDPAVHDSTGVLEKHPTLGERYVEWRWEHALGYVLGIGGMDALRVPVARRNHSRVKFAHVEAGKIGQRLHLPVFVAITTTVIVNGVRFRSLASARDANPLAEERARLEESVNHGMSQDGTIMGAANGAVDHVTSEMAVVSQSVNLLEQCLLAPEQVNPRLSSDDYREVIEFLAQDPQLMRRLKRFTRHLAPCNGPSPVVTGDDTGAEAAGSLMMPLRLTAETAGVSQNSKTKGGETRSLREGGSGKDGDFIRMVYRPESSSQMPPGLPTVEIDVKGRPQTFLLDRGYASSVAADAVYLVAGPPIGVVAENYAGSTSESAQCGVPILSGVIDEHGDLDVTGSGGSQTIMTNLVPPSAKHPDYLHHVALGGGGMAPLGPRQKPLLDAIVCTTGAQGDLLQILSQQMEPGAPDTSGQTQLRARQAREDDDEEDMIALNLNGRPATLGKFSMENGKNAEIRRALAQSFPLESERIERRRPCYGPPPGEGVDCRFCQMRHVKDEDALVCASRKQCVFLSAEPEFNSQYQECKKARVSEDGEIDLFIRPAREKAPGVVVERVSTRNPFVTSSFLRPHGSSRPVDGDCGIVYYDHEYQDCSAGACERVTQTGFAYSRYEDGLARPIRWMDRAKKQTSGCNRHVQLTVAEYRSWEALCREGGSLPVLAVDRATHQSGLGPHEVDDAFSFGPDLCFVQVSALSQTPKGFDGLEKVMYRRGVGEGSSVCEDLMRSGGTTVNWVARAVRREDGTFSDFTLKQEKTTCLCISPETFFELRELMNPEWRGAFSQMEQEGWVTTASLVPGALIEEKHFKSALPLINDWVAAGNAVLKRAFEPFIKRRWAYLIKMVRPGPRVSDMRTLETVLRAQAFEGEARRVVTHFAGSEFYREPGLLNSPDGVKYLIQFGQVLVDSAGEGTRDELQTILRRVRSSVKSSARVPVQGMIGAEDWFGETRIPVLSAARDPVGAANQMILFGTDERPPLSFHLARDHPMAIVGPVRRELEDGFLITCAGREFAVASKLPYFMSQGSIVHAIFKHGAWRMIQGEWRDYDAVYDTGFGLMSATELGDGASMSDGSRLVVTEKVPSEVQWRTALSHHLFAREGVYYIQRVRVGVKEGVTYIAGGARAPIGTLVLCDTPVPDEWMRCGVEELRYPGTDRPYFVSVAVTLYGAVTRSGKRIIRDAQTGRIKVWSERSGVVIGKVFVQQEPSSALPGMIYTGNLSSREKGTLRGLAEGGERWHSQVSRLFTSPTAD